jgi:hypothetical protein
LKPFITIAVVTFTISFLTSLLLQIGITTGAMPWFGFQLRVAEVFMCLASIYLPLTAGIACQILQRKYPWTNPARRLFGTWLLGLTFGLSVSALVAIIGPHGTGQFHVQRYMAIMHDETAESWDQRIKLSRQLESLGMQKTFLECFVPIAVLFGFLTPALMTVYDVFREKGNNRQAR